jgi:hypothetical protein
VLLVTVAIQRLSSVRTARPSIVVHSVLAVAAAVLVGLEARWAQLIDRPAWIWIVVEPLVAAVALAIAWRLQPYLRAVPIVVLALAFGVAWTTVHQVVGFRGDLEPNLLYPSEGHALLHGHYPASEYPVGAVLLFTVEAALGGNSAQSSNRWLILPFQIICVLALLSLRTQRALWLAAVVALWPLDGWYWENRFDLVPAALLIVGLALAHHERWGWSGVALALGTAVKWTPAVASLVLLAWLIAGRRPREAVRHAAAFAATWLTVNLPFLLRAPHNWWVAYQHQSGRAITNESIWYFLRLLGKTGEDRRIWAPAGAPHWADAAAVDVQIVVLLGVLALAVRARQRRDAALAAAALAPAVFLLANKVFSPQFILVIVACWAFAGALVVTSGRAQLALGLLVAAASSANLFVYPYDRPWHVASWRPMSAAMYLAALLATLLLARAVASRTDAASRPEGCPWRR